MANVSYGDAACDQLRALIETLDREITRLPPTSDGGSPHGVLHTSWSQLTKLLALGSKAETRVCPTCAGSGFRAASRCGHCWTKLVPLDDAAPPVLAQVATDAPRTEV